MSHPIQKRDVEILKLAFTYRVITYNQIRDKFFEKNTNSAARRRTSILCRRGLLARNTAVVGEKSVKIVSPTEKAWPLLLNQWAFEIDNPHFKSESPEHDFRLASIGMRFEQLALFRSFISENLLQSSGYFASHSLYKDLVRLQADGALALEDTAGGFVLYGVELEITKKSPDRYEDKLSSYYKANGIDGVIYICGSQEIAALIARADKKIRTQAESIVFVGLESDVNQSSGKLFLKNIEKHGLRLF